MGPATERGRGLVGHLLRIAVIVVVADLIMAYPFLPGAYDRLAVPLSLMVQVFGLVGLLLVPVGGLWLADQVRSGPVGARRDRASSRRGAFSIAALVVGSVVAVAVAIGLTALATAGVALAIAVIGSWPVIAAGGPRRGDAALEDLLVRLSESGYAAEWLDGPSSRCRSRQTGVQRPERPWSSPAPVPPFREYSTDLQVGRGNVPGSTPSRRSGERTRVDCAGKGRSVARDRSRLARPCPT